MEQAKLNKILILWLLSFLVPLFAVADTYKGVGVYDSLTSDNVKIDGNTISTLDTDGALILAPNGTGSVQIPGLTATTVPYLDGSKNLVSSAVTPTELGLLGGLGDVLSSSNTKTLTNKTFDADGSGNSISNIENADIKAAAAIDVNKLAPLTANRVMLTDSSGFASASSITDTILGYVDFSSSGQTQLDSKVAKSTLTTKGDIYVATGASTIARQAIGADNTVLISDSAQTNGLKWGSVSSLSNIAVTATKTSNYTVTSSDDVVPVDSSGGAFTLTLYTAVGNSGKVLRLLKTGTGTNAVTIDANSTETINGLLTLKLVTFGDSLTIVSDGSNWQIIQNNIKVYFEAHQGTPAGSISTSLAALRFTSGLTDPFGIYDNSSTGKLTAPYSGYYTINCTLGFSASSAAVGNYYTAAVLVNSTTYAENFTDVEVVNRITKMANVGATVYLAVGDTVACATRSNATTPITSASGGGSSMSVIRHN